VLRGIATGGCKKTKRRIGLQKLQTIAGRQFTAKAGQRRSNPDKKLVREEIAERRGTSVKK